MFKARWTGIGLTLACLLASPGPASAQSLEILVTESGGPTIPITDNGALDVDPTLGAISVNATLLNLSLVNYSFTGLQANLTTNSLLQKGLVNLLRGGTGTISITAAADTYTSPAGNPKTMTTVASDNFSNTAAGDSRTFQSFFNPTNTLAATEIPSPLLAFVPPVGVGPFNTSNPGVDTPLGAQPTPYALTSTTVLTFKGGFENDEFSGRTTLNAPTTPGVPEPGVCALLGSLSLTAVGLLRRRIRKSL